MRTAVVKGRDPFGLCTYLLDPAKQIEPNANAILATNMSGRSAEELAEEFEFVRNFRPRVVRGVCHFMCSLPPGEKVDRLGIAAISRRLLEQMGHGDCQYFVVQHHDREARNQVQHWHIGTSAVDLFGERVSDKFNYSRLARVSRDLEVEFNLQRSPFRAERLRQNLTTGEYRLRERGGVVRKERLWEHLEAAASEAKQMPDFVAALQARGVSVNLRGLQGNHAIQGISYGLEGIAFAGGRLGPAYSFPGLQNYLGIDYQPERDNAVLLAVIRGEEVPAPIVSSTEILAGIGENLAQAEAIGRRMRQRWQQRQRPQDAPPPVLETPSVESAGEPNSPPQIQIER